MANHAPSGGTDAYVVANFTPATVPRWAMREALEAASDDATILQVQAAAARIAGRDELADQLSAFRLLVVEDADVPEPDPRIVPFPQQARRATDRQDGYTLGYTASADDAKVLRFPR